MTTNPLRLALVLLLGLAALSARADEQPLDRIVAIVDNDIVMASELERRTEVIRQQLQARHTRLPAEATLQSQVLDKLILDRLQLQQAEQIGLKVSDQELDRTLERIAASNGLSLAQFKTQLEAEGQDYREVREQVRSEMVITQVRERLVNRRIQVSDQEVDNFLASEQGRQTAEPDLHLAHIMIPIASPATPEHIQAARTATEQVYQRLQDGADFAETSVAVSKGPKALEGGDLGWRKPSELPEAIAKTAAALEENGLSRPFRLGGGFHLIKLLERRGGTVRMVEQTRVRHILIQPSKIRSKAESEALIRELYRRIRGGEDFAALAKQYSDDSGSGSQGGDLGWTLPGQMVPAFEAAMNATPVGTLSAPFESRFGWHILEVQERRQQDLGQQMLAKEAREAIRKRKFAEELSNWLREIKAQAYIELKL